MEHETAALGDIVAVTGITDLNIGETACDPECVEALPFVRIDEPTISMIFMVNNSPFAGQEGKFVTSRNLRDRLFKEVETNVSMRVRETDTTDAFEVSGRGELHLSILIETMRRQGFEFAVSRPQVIYKKDENGKLLEPMGAADDRGARAVCGRGDGEAGGPQGGNRQHGYPGHGGQPSGIPDSGPGADGLSPAVPHRHQRQRDHEQRVRRV